jgi:hypothetical protein
MRPSYKRTVFGTEMLVWMWTTLSLFTSQMHQTTPNILLARPVHAENCCLKEFSMPLELSKELGLGKINYTIDDQFNLATDTRKLERFKKLNSELFLLLTKFSF